MLQRSLTKAVEAEKNKGWIDCPHQRGFKWVIWLRFCFLPWLMAYSTFCTKVCHYSVTNITIKKRFYFYKVYHRGPTLAKSPHQYASISMDWFTTHHFNISITTVAKIVDRYIGRLSHSNPFLADWRSASRLKTVFLGWRFGSVAS